MDTTSKIRVTEQENLVERLSLQVESFQEGFETLLKCRSIKEMIITFGHLLKGNFILKELYLLYKKKPSDLWEVIGNQPLFFHADLDYLSDGTEYKVNYTNGERITAAVTLPLSDSTVLGILLGKKLNGESLSVVDRITMQVLLQVFNSAHKAFTSQKKIKKLIFELNEKVFQLNNLIDSGIALSKFGQGNSLYQLALERVSVITNSSSALIHISSKINKEEEYFIFPPGTDPASIMNNPGKIESSFELQERHYRIVLSEKESRDGSSGFNELDRTLLDAITRQVSAFLENDFMHKQSLENERIQKELNVAASIQQQIIPKHLPAIKGYELAGKNIPSQEVGGDYYDCIDIGKGKYAIVIADVAGKGIGAALLVNTLSAALYSYMDFNLPLPEMSDKLNKLIYKASPPDKFITFFISVLDSDTGRLDVVNAGHNPVLLLRNDGTLEQITAGGVGLGMFDFNIPFQGQTLEMLPGDKLFLYTDGIPEAMNQTEDEYTDEKMIEFFKQNNNLNPIEFVDAMITDVKSHSAGFPQSDDITLLVLKREQ